jgi:hypothetical protein
MVWAEYLRWTAQNPVPESSDRPRMGRRFNAASRLSSCLSDG